MTDPPLDLEDLLGLGDAVYTADEIDAAAGVEAEFSDKLWLAMGFALIPRDLKAFTESDRDALQAVAAFERGGIADRDLILAIARVLSQSMARVADAEVGAMRAWIQKNVREDGSGLDAAREIAPQVVGSLESFLIHVWRRHLSFAIGRQGLLETGAPEQLMTVGFADLVGFTRLSGFLDEPGLTGVIERLESRSQELVAELGGRVVKSLGDEVMFVADEPATAAEIALTLVDESLADEELPDLRVGLAHGPVVPHRGDFFGATVNLASRAVGVALPASVLVSAGVKDAVKADERYFVKPISTRKLKGLGSTRLWVLRRWDA